MGEWGMPSVEEEEDMREEDSGRNFFALDTMLQ